MQTGQCSLLWKMGHHELDPTAEQMVWCSPLQSCMNYLLWFLFPKLTDFSLCLMVLSRWCLQLFQLFFFFFQVCLFLFIKLMYWIYGSCEVLLQV